MICYKLVKDVNGKYTSLHGDFFPQYNLEYKVGQKVTPKIGKIFVYEKPEQAISLMSALQSNTKILIGAGKRSKLVLSYILDLYRSEHIPDFWNDIFLPEEYFTYYSNPPLLVEDFKPLKIYNEYESPFSNYVSALPYVFSYLLKG